MPYSGPQRIVYLFGAGATNAELSNLDVDVNQFGLLLSDVTKRVTIRAKADAEFLRQHRMFLERAADSSNIELFISLIENNSYDVENASSAVAHLKRLVEEDIRGILTPDRLAGFYLHRALFELHANNPNEIILGLISLNYDTVLDEAYAAYYGEPDYNFSFRPTEGDKPPLLKLHGSFNWDDIEIAGMT